MDYQMNCLKRPSAYPGWHRQHSNPTNVAARPATGQTPGERVHVLFTHPLLYIFRNIPEPFHH
ncbi:MULTISPECIES: hypothetical protein [Mediterranea]|uniref:hypothetical protein n=1 Tax=Mediterranea TaxID=1926659 RepID=UPI002012FB22|nr:MULTISPECIES: hypothetical protein [Mediterranea]MCL1608458.1 hypothetical protein [Mediterranea sp. ET5]MDM8123838.1 hypothetical protein [Mediterranea massiliensis]MDM8198838.1 hypothetical protein [Mediterranea massiliensis]